jgi:hypothetical protein
MNSTKAAKQSQDFRSQDSLRQDSQRPYSDLDTRYGKIGISAVAAALCHQGEQQTGSEYRIPYDRD